MFQNVLIASLTPIKVKLADFGISKSTAGTDLRTLIGTAHYMAPEQLRILPMDLRLGNEYTTAVDLWALGFIVHELLTGKTPFVEIPVEAMSSGYPNVDTGSNMTDMLLLMQFCQGNAVLPLEPLAAVDAPNSAVLFIKSLVVPDPRARASAAQALLDPWITAQVTQTTLPQTTPQPKSETHDLQGESWGKPFHYMEPSRNELPEIVSVVPRPQYRSQGQRGSPPATP